MATAQLYLCLLLRSSWRAKSNMRGRGDCHMPTFCDCIGQVALQLSKMNFPYDSSIDAHLEVRTQQIRINCKQVTPRLPEVLSLSPLSNRAALHCAWMPKDKNTGLFQQNPSALMSLLPLFHPQINFCLDRSWFARRGQGLPWLQDSEKALSELADMNSSKEEKGHSHETRTARTSCDDVTLPLLPALSAPSETMFLWLRVGWFFLSPTVSNFPEKK